MQPGIRGVIAADAQAKGWPRNYKFQGERSGRGERVVVRGREVSARAPSASAARSRTRLRSAVDSRAAWSRPVRSGADAAFDGSDGRRCATPLLARRLAMRRAARRWAGAARWPAVGARAACGGAGAGRGGAAPRRGGFDGRPAGRRRRGIGGPAGAGASGGAGGRRVSAGGAAVPAGRARPFVDLLARAGGDGRQLRYQPVAIRTAASASTSRPSTAPRTCVTGSSSTPPGNSQSITRGVRWAARWA